MELIEINQYEFDLLTKLRLCTSYTPTEANFLQQMADKHLEEKVRICTSGCSKSVTEFKQKFFGWFLFNKDKIEAQLNAEKQVNNYTQST